MTRRGSRSWVDWNRKLHVYVGLYFVVFIWLFVLSGLLLNHSWRFAEFWSQRRQSAAEHSIVRPPDGDHLDRARNLMGQLRLAGEIEWKAESQVGERFDFRVVQPGSTVDVKADFLRKTARLEETRVNGWGAVRMLHTFSGVRAGAVRGERDWWLTRLWSLSMDALCVGLIVLVLGSAVMAIERREKWTVSGVAVALGLAVTGFFVFGLRLL